VRESTGALDLWSRAKESFMNKVTRIASISTFAFVLATGGAHADPGKTREQVQAELVAAQMAGEVPVGADGLTPRERFPSLYPKVAADPAKSRTQVAAELAAAQLAGAIPFGADGKSPRERAGSLYPEEAMSGPEKTRDQIRAELTAAQKDGDLPIGFAAIPARDLFPGRYPISGAAQSVARSGSSLISSGAL
jgi:hypothetical protein